MQPIVVRDTISCFVSIAMHIINFLVDQPTTHFHSRVSRLLGHDVHIFAIYLEEIKKQTLKGRFAREKYGVNRANCHKEILTIC